MLLRKKAKSNNNPATKKTKMIKEFSIITVYNNHKDPVKSIQQTEDDWIGIPHTEHEPLHFNSLDKAMGWLFTNSDYHKITYIQINNSDLLSLKNPERI